MFTKFNATTQFITAFCFFTLAIGCSSSHVHPRVAADLPGYCEGIVFDANGTAYVSTLHRESVFAIRGASSPEKWHLAIEPNGHKILPDGTHLIAAKGGVHHVAPDGTLIEVLAPELATPNDLAIDGDGGVYVTAPAQSDQDKEAMRSGVYYIDPTHVVRKVADDLCYPNGVVVRADGRSLLVNDSCNRRLYEFRIDAPGVLSHRRLLAEIPDPKSVPDGMTFDQAGRLYMADYGLGVVRVFNPAGRMIRTYPTGLEHPSNVAFDNRKLTDLYVTGSPKAEDGLGQLIVLPLGIDGRSSLTMPASIR